MIFSETKTCAHIFCFSDLFFENKVSEYTLHFNRRLSKNSTTSVRYRLLKGRIAYLNSSCLVAFKVSLAVYFPIFVMVARFSGVISVSRLSQTVSLIYFSFSGFTFIFDIKR